MTKLDPHDLARFVDAQSDTYDHACRELRAGRKHSHWIWFIFPQMKGLGSSTNASFYGIGSLDEARAFLAHPVLGPRLEEVTRLMLTHRHRTLHEILGSPDDLKFRSSMTLFSKAAGPESIFREALDAFCDGREDPGTLALLRGTNHAS